MILCNTALGHPVCPEEEGVYPTSYIVNKALDEVLNTSKQTAANDSLGHAAVAQESCYFFSSAKTQPSISAIC